MRSVSTFLMIPRFSLREKLWGIAEALRGDSDPIALPAKGSGDTRVHAQNSAGDFQSLMASRAGVELLRLIDQIEDFQFHATGALPECNSRHSDARFHRLNIYATVPSRNGACEQF